MRSRSENLVWKLLRRNIAPGQLIGYAVANLVGLLIVISATQLYYDINSPYSDSSETLVSTDYLIISKRVDGIGALTSSSSFTQEQLSDIESQPWAKKVGHFIASDFNVYATTDFGGTGMSTYLFFESIPDGFLDRQPEQWGFDPMHPFIPIILSKDYLALYNFGFATSRGLPQISESMIGMIPLRVSISGNGRQQWIPARVVGFSSRLNTIAVPQQFMDWANARFADSISQPAPSRLIIEVNNPGDPAIKSYLDKHSLESAGDKATNNRMSYLLTVMTGIVIAIGLIFTAMAVFILFLSLYLLLQKNKEKLRDLILIGYLPGRLARCYIRLVVAINSIVLAIGITLMLTFRSHWVIPLRQLGLADTTPLMSIVIATALITAITAINAVTIRRHIARSFCR